MTKREKPSKAFSFCVIAAILILTNAVLLGAVARWFIGIMPTLPGSSGNDPMVLYGLSAVGSVFGVLVLLGALMLQRAPFNGRLWGIMIVVFSIPSVIMGGGFIVGFILGIIGGKLVISEKKMPKKPKNIKTSY